MTDHKVHVLRGHLLPFAMPEVYRADLIIVPFLAQR